MTEALVVRLDGVEVGELLPDATLRWVDGWARLAPMNARVLSHSLPFGASGLAAGPFFGGLLPEGAGLERLAQETRLASNDLVGLLAEVGAEPDEYTAIGGDAYTLAGMEGPFDVVFVAPPYPHFRETPERIDKLVLGATSAGGAGGSSFPLHTLQDLPPRERARRAMEVSDLSFTPEWQQANPEQVAERLDARVAQVTRFADEPGRRDGELAQLEARSHHDTYERLDQITAATLVLAGSRDGQAPKAAGQALAERIRDCRFEVHEGSHAMIQENPDVCQSIIAFLTS